MFPERSGRTVLDRVVGDTHLDHDGMRRYARAWSRSSPPSRTGPRSATTPTARTATTPPTPHLGAELLRAESGDRARLVSVEDSGHGAYVLGGNAYASDVTTRYLVDGELPADDASCPAS